MSTAVSFEPRMLIALRQRCLLQIHDALEEDKENLREELILEVGCRRSLNVARRLRAGFIGINGTAGDGADAPFGGYKNSGIGRQSGTAGFGQYTEVKSVAYPA